MLWFFDYIRLHMGTEAREHTCPRQEEWVSDESHGLPGNIEVEARSEGHFY